MPLESASFVSQLSTSNPASGDAQSQGDDHLRLIKAVLQATFPNASRAFRFPSGVATKASDYTVVATTDENQLIPISASAAARTVTLPTASLFDGLTFAILKVDSSVNAVTLSSAANINGASTLVLRHQYDMAVLWYNAADATWYALTVSRGFIAPVSTSSDVTLDIKHHKNLLQVSASGANRTVTLPNTFPAGFKCKVRKSDTTANTVTLDATSGGQINGANTISLQAPYETIEIEWDGTTWTAPVYDSIPPGATQFWWFDTAPTGWAILAGQAISRTGNPRLFARFSTTYGVGDGSTTFNLPDPRGLFPRIWDNGKGEDADSASRTAPAGTSITAGDHVGTKQTEKIGPHTHPMEFLSIVRDAGSSHSLADPAAFGSSPDRTMNTDSNTGTENRPKNFAIAMIIKLG